MITLKYMGELVDIKNLLEVHGLTEIEYFKLICKSDKKTLCIDDMEYQIINEVKKAKRRYTKWIYNVTGRGLNILDGKLSDIAEKTGTTDVALTYHFATKGNKFEWEKYCYFRELRGKRDRIDGTNRNKNIK